MGISPEDMIFKLQQLRMTQGQIDKTWDGMGWDGEPRNSHIYIWILDITRVDIINW